MRMLLQGAVFAFVVLASGCQSLETSIPAAPTMKQALVDGVTLNYLEQGQGATVVFVHGAFSDHRNWDAQRAEVSKHYRFIALDQRYFGTAPWADNATKYSLANHANDLAAFIQQLNSGPVACGGLVLRWRYSACLGNKAPRSGSKLVPERALAGINNQRSC